MEEKQLSGRFVKIDGYVKNLSTRELRKYFPAGQIEVTIKSGKNKGQKKFVPKFTNAYMMRSLIMNEKEHYHSSEPRTLRGVWYSCVKPVLDKLGLLEDDAMSDDGMKRWDAILSNYVCDLLRSGDLMFSDLGIQDISRKKSNPRETFYSVSGNSFGYKGSLAPYPNILIATEKDTVYSIISKMATLLGLSCISCKGQNALGAMESIIKGMFPRSSYAEPDFESVIILTLTDYDPAGYYIANALEKQAADILKAIDREGFPIEIQRIGITPDQLDEEQVQQNKYSPKKANIDKWMQMTGGIDGEEKGLELDALSNQQIREIFVEGLRDYIDEEIYLDFVKESWIREQAILKLRPYADALLNRMKEFYEGDLTIDDEFSVLDLAEEGKRYIETSDIVKDRGGKWLRRIGDDIEELFSKEKINTYFDDKEPFDDEPDGDYDENGFDESGYDKDGFNAEGYDRDGYDEDGYDEWGDERED